MKTITIQIKKKLTGYSCYFKGDLINKGFENGNMGKVLETIRKYLEDQK